MAAGRRLWVSLLASFSVYLFPLVRPHAVSVFGLALAMELGTQAEKRGSLWITADVALAVAFQAAAWGIFYWFFRRPGWLRSAGLLGGLAALLVPLHWLYMIAIPGHFLIEPDKAPERESGRSVAPSRTGG